MKKYASFFDKTDKTIIGVLSGTSVDGIDVVLTKIHGSGVTTNIKVIDFETYPIESRLKKLILKCSSKQDSNVEDICKLNFIVGDLFAKSINKLISRNKLLKEDIDLIGSHGQTIYHIPLNEKLFGFSSKSTLQIGDPSVIANRTGITTVGDFRVADVAVMGDGAPLVPYLDYILLKDKKKNRAFINIGGIANITYLKSSCSPEDVIAFDTGPGNLMIDYLMKKFFNRKFDKDGKVALGAEVIENIFKYICSADKFYKKQPPKSTGREYYSATFIENILKQFPDCNNENIISTFTKFTSFSIYSNLKNYKIDELFISGGGAKNPAIINFLSSYFKGVDVKIFNKDGITSDNKEAVLFAVLANELICGNKTNMRSVTGSRRNVFLGKICPA